MKVSYKWLNEYVNTDNCTAKELAEKLTRSGIEVDFVESRNKGVTGVVVGYVEACSKHPDADKLNVCAIDVGQADKLQIVCGAANIAAGQKVPVAVVGAVLPDNFKIKRAKLRGVESQGMICSAKELGLDDKLLAKDLQEGIYVLPNETAVGLPIVELFALDDEVLELDLTPNRSDCLSMIGTAYEVAAILGEQALLQLPQVESGQFDETLDNPVQVEIHAPERCTHYAARYIEGVRIAPSPLWMQHRLMAAGIRPINNVVDITNYVMLEYGQPLHAFDGDKLATKRIEVRMAQAGETMQTLDDLERTLTEEDLLITNDNKAIALAGVMGGAGSEVTESTTTIVLESAHFIGSGVRKTSRRLGLRSESSLRFEKEADPNVVNAALDRAAYLLAQYAEGRVSAHTSQVKVGEPEATSLDLSLARINGYLGTSLALEEVEQLFARLRFSTTRLEAETLRVAVPSRRGDISRDVDLIEEVARLYGYDHIPTTLLTGETTPGHLNHNQRARRAIRHKLSSYGLNETIQYAFTDPNQRAAWPGLYHKSTAVALGMPMSEERSVLRTSLVPHLLDAVEYNRKRLEETVALFEIGKVFLSDEQQLTRLPEERELLAIAWTGRKLTEHWQVKPESVDFYDLKGVCEQLLQSLGIKRIDFRKQVQDGLHPGRTAEVVVTGAQGEVVIGHIGQLHPEIQQQRGFGDVYLLEVELDRLYPLIDFEISYNQIPRYPAVTRDIALVVDEQAEVGVMLQSVIEAGGDLLEHAELFDIYRGTGVENDKKSVAFALTYRTAERTLTDEEVSERHDAILALLAERHGATLRK